MLTAQNVQLDRALKNDKNGEFLRGLKHLRILDISENNLNALPTNIFQDQIETLRKVILDYNHFNLIPSAVLKIQHLRELHFQGNSFATFSSRERETIDRWREIILSFRGNLFMCTCDELESLKWIVQSKRKFISFDEIMCQNGMKLHLFLKDIHYFEIHCMSREWLIISFSLSLIVSIVIVGTAMLYRFRYSACFYFLQARKYFKNDTEFGFNYDVFISYTPDDGTNCEWTIHTLYPFLINNVGLNV